MRNVNMKHGYAWVKELPADCFRRNDRDQNRQISAAVMGNICMQIFTDSHWLMIS